MIDYNDGYFNTATLFRVYGSASYKALVFAVISSAIYLIMGYFVMGYFDSLHEWLVPVMDLKDDNLMDHPYPVSVIISAFMFVLSAKVTLSYNRYWEACTALHNMHSKWLDAGSLMAAFHMQSKAYEKIQPPSFGDQPHLSDSLQRGAPNGLDECRTFTSDDGLDGESTLSVGSLENREHRKQGGEPQLIHTSPAPPGLPFPEHTDRSSRYRYHKGTSSSGISMCIGESKQIPPTLFLQEAAHLVSLLSAVALSTLRCDSDEGESPLVEFVPGRRWPSYNSEDDRDTKEDGHRRNRCATTWEYVFDLPRAAAERQRYNAGRPFPVVGGMATLWVDVCVFLVPILLLERTAPWFGLVLNFLIVLLLAGLNELSKELESPFRGVPNDLPLNLFQAQFNEALVTMFGGFHPDAWWEIKGDA